MRAPPSNDLLVGLAVAAGLIAAALGALVPHLN